MTTMPTDWSPLSDGCPVPGDPDEVYRLSQLYSSIAQEIDQQAQDLKTLSSVDGWDSDAAKKFQGAATSLAGDISKAYNRYEAAYTVLNTWYGDLEDYQQRAVAELGKAQEAQRQITSIQGQQQSVSSQQNAASQQAANATTPPTPAQAAAASQQSQELSQQASQLSSQLSAAQGQLEAARKALAGIVSDYHSQGQSLSSQLNDTIQHDGLHNTFWGGVGEWIHDHVELLNKIAEVLEKIASVLGDIAAVLELLGALLPPPIDAALEAIAEVINVVVAVLAVVQLGIALAEYLDGYGDGSLTTVLLDAGQVGLSLIGLKAGGGKDAAEDALKDTASAATGEGRRAAKDAANDVLARGGGTADKDVLKSAAHEAREGVTKGMTKAASKQVVSDMVHHPTTIAKVLGKKAIGQDAKIDQLTETALSKATTQQGKDAILAAAGKATKAGYVDKGVDVVSEGYEHGKDLYQHHEVTPGNVTKAVYDTVTPVPTSAIGNVVHDIAHPIQAVSPDKTPEGGHDGGGE